MATAITIPGKATTQVATCLNPIGRRVTSITSEAGKPVISKTIQYNKRNEEVDKAERETTRIGQNLSIFYKSKSRPSKDVVIFYCSRRWERIEEDGQKTLKNENSKEWKFALSYDGKFIITKKANMTRLKDDGGRIVKQQEITENQSFEYTDTISECTVYNPEGEVAKRRTKINTESVTFEPPYQSFTSTKSVEGGYDIRYKTPDTLPQSLISTAPHVERIR